MSCDYLNSIEFAAQSKLWGQRIVDQLMARLDARQTPESRRHHEQWLARQAAIENEVQRILARESGRTIKTRADGKGHPWAMAHRFMLPQEFYATDFDALNVVDDDGAHLIHSEDRLFAEYATRRGSSAFIAFFDMKRGRSSVPDKSAAHRSRVYIDLCYAVGKGQGVIKPKFFYVYGDRTDEWQIEEVDLVTRQRSGRLHSLNRIHTWKPVWDLLGLTTLRRRAEEWVRHEGTK